MKKLIYTLIAACTVQYATAQELEKIVTKDYVDNLIKTLASDAMEGRRPGTPGIEKAATFIEGEFKAIGLKPLAGLKGFRQSFDKYQVKSQSVKVTVNGKAVADENVYISGVNSEKTNFDHTTGDGVIVLDTAKTFQAQVRALARGKKQLIIVPAKFAGDIKRQKSFGARPGTFDGKDMSKPTANVFVISDEGQAATFSVEGINTVVKVPYFNVAGMIPGKSKEKEIVIFSGHYDHLGIGKAVGQDSINNGADDDASGTTAMIALAKYYKKLNNNERTLVFVAFTAEESGGFGAKYFSQQLNPDDIVAMFNIEMIGKDSKFGPNTAYITGYEKSDFGKILQKNLEGTEFTFHPDPYPSQNLFYRSDNATLAALGVPAHTISTVQIDKDNLYHTVKDEYSSLNTENIYATIKGIAKSAIGIVKGVDTPKRVEKLQTGT